MVGLGGHWAGSIGSRRADASNRGYPEGLWSRAWRSAPGRAGTASAFGVVSVGFVTRVGA